MVNYKKLQKNEKSHWIDVFFAIFSSCLKKVLMWKCRFQLYFVLQNVDFSTKVKHWAGIYFDQPDERFTRLQSSINGQLFLSIKPCKGTKSQPLLSGLGFFAQRPKLQTYSPYCIGICSGVAFFLICNCFFIQGGWIRGIV